MGSTCLSGKMLPRARVKSSDLNCKEELLEASAATIEDKDCFVHAFDDSCALFAKCTARSFTEMP